MRVFVRDAGAGVCVCVCVRCWSRGVCVCVMLEQGWRVLAGKRCLSALVLTGFLF